MDAVIKIQNIPFGRSTGLISKEIKHKLAQNEERVEFWQYQRHNAKILLDRLDRPIGYIVHLNKSILESIYTIPYTIMTDEDRSDINVCIYASEINSPHLSRIFCALNGKWLEPYEVTRQSCRYIEEGGLISISLNEQNIISINQHEIRISYPKKGSDYAWIQEMGIYNGDIDYLDLAKYRFIAGKIKKIIRNRLENFPDNSTKLAGYMVRQ